MLQIFYDCLVSWITYKKKNQKQKQKQKTNKTTTNKEKKNHNIKGIAGVFFILKTILR